MPAGEHLGLQPHEIEGMREARLRGQESAEISSPELVVFPSAQRLEQTGPELGKRVMRFISVDNMSSEDIAKHIEDGAVRLAFDGLAVPLAKIPVQ